MKKKPSATRRTSPFIPTVEIIEQIRREMLNYPNRRRRPDYGQRDALMISLMAYQGPRPEELRSLTWKDCGLGNGLMEITAEKAKREKSKTLTRNLPLNAVVAEELEAWASRLGNPPAHSPVLPLPEWGKRRGGEAWTEENWKDWRERIFKPALKRAAEVVAENDAEFDKIVRMRPYDLRHTAVSLWLANGGKDDKGRWDGSNGRPADVAEWAGHEVRTMWETYAHKMDTPYKVPIEKQIRDAREAAQ